MTSFKLSNMRSESLKSIQDDIEVLAILTNERERLNRSDSHRALSTKSLSRRDSSKKEDLDFFEDDEMHEEDLLADEITKRIKTQTR